MSTAPHAPVMPREVIELLAVRWGGRYVDCTTGAGGHLAAILDAGAPDCVALGLDADPEALRLAEERLRAYGARVRLVNANFRDLAAVCRRENFAPVAGVLFDLGVSSMQMDSSERGFSFQHPDAPLDMRMDPGQSLTAGEIINTWAQDDLAALLWKYGEERHSRRVARQIVAARPIQTAGQLARIVEQVAGRAGSKIHPATRSFQALRIAVNDELGAIEAALRQALDLLDFGARLVVISFHSLEDRIVKQFIQRESRDCICPPGLPICVCGHVAQLRPVTRGVLTPAAEELAANRRSRSAKLRAAERVAA